MIVSSWQHCDEQQFQNSVMCTLHNFLSCRKLDLFMRAQLLDHILALKKERTRLAYTLFEVNTCCRNKDKLQSQFPAKITLRRLQENTYKVH